ncbi:hypothetical protein HKD37_19G053331 [Glycine soja]
MEKLKNIVISLEMATTVEVEVRKVVVVSEPMVVVEVQERKAKLFILLSLVSYKGLYCLANHVWNLITSDSGLGSSSPMDFFDSWKMNDNGMEKEEREETPLQGEDESRRSSPS